MEPDRFGTTVGVLKVEQIIADFFVGDDCSLRVGDRQCVLIAELKIIWLRVAGEDMLPTGEAILHFSNSPVNHIRCSGFFF